MPAIHLIARKQENVHPVPGAPGEWESGNWVVSDETAASLVGGSLYLHEGQSAPSYFGGTILSYRVLQKGDDEGRVVFRFRFEASHKGTPSSRGGWSQEKKIVSA